MQTVSNVYYQRKVLRRSLLIIYISSLRNKNSLISKMKIHCYLHPPDDPKYGNAMKSEYNEQLYDKSTQVMTEIRNVYHKSR